MMRFMLYKITIIKMCQVQQRGHFLH